MLHVSGIYMPCDLFSVHGTLRLTGIQATVEPQPQYGMSIVRRYLLRHVDRLSGRVFSICLDFEIAALNFCVR